MAARQIPAKMRQIMVQKLSSNFKDATKIVEVDVPKPGPKQVLVKHKFVGINASDIIHTSGGYRPDVPPPYGAGLEALGEVVQAGSEASLKVGQAVAFSNFGSFCEYSAIDEALCAPVPSLDPAFLSLIVSGTTASIALEEKGNLKQGENVLVTAAAGGTGQFAVQIAKAAGCHVIGTCSSPAKAEFLKGLGCDRVINYTTEKFAEVLPKEYPKGIDVVYECVGGEIYNACITNLAVKGRLIVIGAISQYEGHESKGMQDPPRKTAVWRELLRISADLRGFFLPDYRTDIPRHIQTLAQQYMAGTLKIITDRGQDGKNFVGLEAVYDAVEYMYTKKNMGKIVVDVDASTQAAL